MDEFDNALPPLEILEPVEGEEARNPTLDELRANAETMRGILRTRTRSQQFTTQQSDAVAQELETQILRNIQDVHYGADSGRFAEGQLTDEVATVIGTYHRRHETGDIIRQADGSLSERPNIEQDQAQRLATHFSGTTTRFREERNAARSQALTDAYANGPEELPLVDDLYEEDWRAAPYPEHEPSEDDTASGTDCEACTQTTCPSHPRHAPSPPTPPPPIELVFPEGEPPTKKEVLVERLRKGKETRMEKIKQAVIDASLLNLKPGDYVQFKTHEELKDIWGSSGSEAKVPFSFSAEMGHRFSGKTFRIKHLERYNNENRDGILIPVTRIYLYGVGSYNFNQYMVSQGHPEECENHGPKYKIGDYVRIMNAKELKELLLQSQDNPATLTMVNGYIDKIPPNFYGYRFFIDSVNDNIDARASLPRYGGIRQISRDNVILELFIVPIDVIHP